MAEPEFTDVAGTSELPPGSQRIVQARGREIALFNVEGRIYAIDNTCFHRGGPLGEGLLEGTVVTCPWHEWSFDVRTGKCTFNPDASVDTFDVRVTDGRIQVGW